MKGLRFRTTKGVQPAPPQTPQPRITQADCDDFAAKLEIVAAKIRAAGELVVSSDRDESVGGYAALLIVGRDLAPFALFLFASQL